MARRYDSRTTIFSPEGRLYQVEYAMEAISHAGTALGILATDGIVLVAEKKVVSKLLDPKSSNEKIYALNDHMVCAVAGITADANILIEDARRYTQDYKYTYGEDIPVEQLIVRLCNVKQAYTLYGGLRPYGVSLLYAGYDEHFGLQLYQSDPSGNYSGWKASCIGANNQAAQSILKQEYKPEMDSKKAVELALKIMSKTMDTATLSKDRLEFAMLKVKDGKPHYQIYSPEQLETLLKEYESTLEASGETSAP